MKCPKCKRTIPGIFPYCDYCGASVTKIAKADVSKPAITRRPRLTRNRVILVSVLGGLILYVILAATVLGLAPWQTKPQLTSQSSQTLPTSPVSPAGQPDSPVPEPTPYLTTSIPKPSVLATLEMVNSPWFIEVNPSSNRIYVASYGSNTIPVIDGVSNRLLTTVKVGNINSWLSTCGSISVNPSSNRIYVTNYGSRTVSVIDGVSNTEHTVMALETLPLAIGVNPRTNHIYVASANDHSSDGIISVIDGASERVLAKIELGNLPHATIGVDPSNDRIYLANYGSNTVSVIDGVSNKVIATINVGEGPEGIGVNSSTNRIYVANYGSNTVSVIDGISNEVVATVNVGDGPEGIGVNSSTNRIYVANFHSNTISVIDGISNEVVATVNVGEGPRGIGINPSTNRIYVANSGSNSLSVIEDEEQATQPSQTISPTTPQKIIFEDDFSNPESGWPSNEGLGCQYENNEYSLKLDKVKSVGPAIYVSNYKIGDLSDFILEVDTWCPDDDESNNSNTLIGFREMGDFNKKYLLLMNNSAGKYALQKYHEPITYDYLVDWTASDYIKTCKNKNRIKIICKGADIEVYINNQRLTTVTDSTYTMGSISLGVEAEEGRTAHIYFDNLKLYEVK